MRLTKAGAVLLISSPAFTAAGQFKFPGQLDPSTDTSRVVCPVSCSVGPTGFSWTEIRKTKYLSLCNETQLFQASIKFPIDSTETRSSIRACTASGDVDAKFGPVCAASATLQAAKADFEVGTVNGQSNATVKQVADAADQVRKNLLVDPTCGASTVFAKSGNAIIGLYVGSEIRKSTAAPIVQKFIDYIASAGSSLPAQLTVQLCGDDRSAPHVFGIVANTQGDISAAHSALATWNDAGCVSGFDSTTIWTDQEFSIIPGTAITAGVYPALGASSNTTVANSTSPFSNSTSGNATLANSTVVGRFHERRVRRNGDSVPLYAKSEPERLEARDICTSYTVAAGDTCWSIATQKCGVSYANFTSYNGGSDSFCNNLAAGQSVCCSAGTSPAAAVHGAVSMAAASTCSYVLVNSMDTCTTIAQNRCGGISLSTFISYNGGDASFCNNLKIKAPVCCSAGDKPDLSPQKGSDGSCSSYTINTGELCFDIADAHYISTDDIEKFNKGKTWGWEGCARLMPNMNICLSDGDPPMPAPVEGNVCGPQKPGTSKPASGTKLADLNQCPLNTCCDIWGQCGNTPTFCTDTTVDDTPGTAQNGTNGCISNCGLDVVKSDAPAEFKKVAYFEAWNVDRPCLNMDVVDIPDDYTTVHFAFGGLTSAFQVNMTGVIDQFTKFVDMTTATPLKRVISFGGWAFSTDAATIQIFRNGVLPANRDTFANAIVAFVENNKLDGVDFDWEYPGATDIPDTTPGSTDDGPNYLKFLQTVKSRLPAGKTVSIAAPASYWYLRNFPIKDIAKIVDYIIYMTYDLHGQWDVGNAYSDEGCDGGNCLRSHVNSTETEWSLAMVTKAGVPSNKVVVGVSSYGRSFKMSEAGCTGPDCTYLGERNKSPAEPGECTQTGGYIADAEIKQIMAIIDAGYSDDGYTLTYDAGSDSNILVYNQTEWVAYMDDTTKDSRTSWYQGMNMAGTSDWAVDLQKPYEVNDSPDYVGLLDLSCDFTKPYADLDALDADAEDLEPTCAAIYALRILREMLDDSFAGYDAAADGYDGMFDIYAGYIKDTLDSRLEIFMGGSDKDTDGTGFWKCYYADGFNPPNHDGATAENCNDLSNWPGGISPPIGTYFYELQDKDGWEKFLGTQGVDVSWVTYGRWEETIPSTCPQDSLCSDIIREHEGFPIRNQSMVITDPKEIVDKARANLDNMHDEFDQRLIELGLDLYEGTPEDLVSVLAVPIYMVTDAIDQMTEVKNTAKDVKDEKLKQLIITILTGVLFLIPFLGEAVGELGAIGASLARFIVAFDAAANAGLSIYTIVDDPASAPVAIMGMLMGGLPGRNAKSYNELAGLKSEMKTEARDAMGKTMTKLDPKIESIIGKACGRA